MLFFGGSSEFYTQPSCMMYASMSSQLSRHQQRAQLPIPQLAHTHFTCIPTLSFTHWKYRTGTMNRYTKTNTNTNRSDFDTAADLQLSSTSNLSNSSSFQQQQLQQQQGQHQGGGGRSLTNNQDGHINDLFQDSGTNKPVKISPSNKHLRA